MRVGNLAAKDAKDAKGFDRVYLEDSVLKRNSRKASFEEIVLESNRVRD